MSIDPKELLLKMKKCEFVFDTTVGKALNKNHEEDKRYVLKILDLLHENRDRVKYVDDLSSSKLEEPKWAVLISEKLAMLDKRVPIPQVPFHIVVDGKNKLTMRSKNAYLLLVGFFQELEDDIQVCLNFRNAEYRKVFRENLTT